MGKELAVIEAVQLPAVNNPARVPSLPAWLRQRVDALANADRQEWANPKQPQIPQTMILDSSQRKIVRHHIDGLERFLNLSQKITLREKVLTNDQAHGVMIAGLLLRGGARLDQSTSDVMTEEYLDAIEDLPAWAVREAIRKWNRGESAQLDRKPHDFTWRPAPATLARLARLEAWAIRGRVVTLRRLLDAIPFKEYSDDHRLTMLEELSKVMHAIADKKPKR